VITRTLYGEGKARVRSVRNENVAEMIMDLRWMTKVRNTKLHDQEFYITQVVLLQWSSQGVTVGLTCSSDEGYKKFIHNCGGETLKSQEEDWRMLKCILGR
jgi:hypothetical protein